MNPEHETIHIDVGNGLPCCDTPQRWKKILIPKRFQDKTIPLKRLDQITAADEDVLCVGCVHALYVWAARIIGKRRRRKNNEWIGIQIADAEE